MLNDGQHAAMALASCGVGAVFETVRPFADRRLARPMNAETKMCVSVALATLARDAATGCTLQHAANCDTRPSRRRQCADGSTRTADAPGPHDRGPPIAPAPAVSRSEPPGVLTEVQASVGYETAFRSVAPSDAALLVAARASEAWAIEALYRRHAGVVYGLARRVLGNDSEVDDLVQETFIGAFATLDSLRDPSAFRTWVCGTLVRRAGKLLRRRRLLGRLGLRDPLPPPDVDSIISRSAPPDVVTEIRAVYALVDGLPTDERTALILRRIEGATLEEIAELTGCSLATVKRRLSRAGAALAIALAHGGLT